MGWTAEALERCGCGHSPAEHDRSGVAGVLRACGACGCLEYDPRADVVAKRGQAVIWDLAHRLRAANASGERLRAVALALRDGRTEAAREALDGLQAEDLAPVVAPFMEGDAWQSAES